jgi:hypothetical protein
MHPAKQEFDIIRDDELGIIFTYERHGWMHTGFIHANKDIPADRRLTYLCYEIMDHIRHSDHTECYKKMESGEKNRVFVEKGHNGVTVEAHGELAERVRAEYKEREDYASDASRPFIDLDRILRSHGFQKTSQNNYSYGVFHGRVGSVEIWEKN